MLNRKHLPLTLELANNLPCTCHIMPEDGTHWFTVYTAAQDVGSTIGWLGDYPHRNQSFTLGQALTL